MAEFVVHHAEGLVRVTWQPALQAVYLKWYSEYDEGTRVRDAVLAVLAWVRTNKVEHWVADVSTSPHALSERDYEWVSGEDFRAAVLDSPLRKFVLIPPLPESGQDDAWVADWEANTLSRFGDRVSARVCKTLDEARDFLSEPVA
ncbi:hypothetical protein [Ruegeria aquimaris]|uniref:Uncharacterized protein n=1 Tax=Ruegeria aquimaris TaxID=2984333 RepID=A0ABT3AP84_9RHOB|nr:hypothetical protein [Ruegeria sp. XHP0148]MCV2890092.1 hypothetical protein [Ruegeria sp. XHP0148]